MSTLESVTAADIFNSMEHVKLEEPVRNLLLKIDTACLKSFKLCSETFDEDTIGSGLKHECLTGSQIFVEALT